MEEDYTKKSNYGKTPLWLWVVIYLIIAAVVYGLVYYFFFMNNNSYVAPQNQTQTQTQNSNVLDLSNQGLTSIPSSVFNQTNLEELNVSHNSLTGAIQSQIGQLKNLKVLNASYNQMTGVPAEVGQLQNLEVLDLSYNKLTGLPNELGNLQNLITLNLLGNAYSQQDLAGIKSKLPATTNIITGQQATQPAKLTASVSIKNFAFAPTPLTVKVGTTVTWTNSDPMAHRISGSGFQSNNLAQGQSYSFVFNNIGTFNYICSIHPSMTGEIIVTQ